MSLKEMIARKAMLGLTDEQLKLFEFRVSQNPAKVFDYIFSLSIDIDKHKEMRFSSPTIFTTVSSASLTFNNSIEVGMEWLKANLSDENMAEFAAWRLEGKI